MVNTIDHDHEERPQWNPDGCIRHSSAHSPSARGAPRLPKGGQLTALPARFPARELRDVVAHAARNKCALLGRIEHEVHPAQVRPDLPNMLRNGLSKT